MDSEAKAFNWKLYGEPFQTAISGIKKILNAFIFGLIIFAEKVKDYTLNLQPMEAAKLY